MTPRDLFALMSLSSRLCSTNIVVVSVKSFRQTINFVSSNSFKRETRTRTQTAGNETVGQFAENETTRTRTALRSSLPYIRELHKISTPWSRLAVKERKSRLLVSHPPHPGASTTAHSKSIILAASSPVVEELTTLSPNHRQMMTMEVVVAVAMAAMLHHDMEEKRSRTVEIKDVKVEVFKQILQYMNTGVPEQLDRDGLTADMLVAADKVAVETLNEDCASSLARQLRVDNACHTLVLEKKNDADSNRRECNCWTVC